MVVAVVARLLPTGGSPTRQRNAGGTDGDSPPRPVLSPGGPVRPVEQFILLGGETCRAIGSGTDCLHDIEIFSGILNAKTMSQSLVLYARLDVPRLPPVA